MKIHCPCCQVEFEAESAITEQTTKDTQRLNFLEEHSSSIFTDLETQENGDFRFGVECWTWLRGDYKRPFRAQTYRSAIDRAMTAFQKHQEDMRPENIEKRVQTYKKIHDTTGQNSEHQRECKLITRKPKAKKLF